MRVVTAEGVGLVRDERVRAALREMKMSRKGGQIDTARLVRAVALVSEVACELLIAAALTGNTITIASQTAPFETP